MPVGAPQLSRAARANRLDDAIEPLHTRPVPIAHALLLENVHATAQEVLSAHDIAVTRVSAGLAGDDLVEAIRNVPGDGPVLIGIRSKTKVRTPVMEAVPRLAGIGCFCIGTDQVDLDDAARLGLSVFNAPFSSTRSVAELVLGQVIMLSRQIFPRNKAAHDGRWAKSASGSHEVRGKTLGIVGYGHIGSQLSVLAEALGLEVRYHDVVQKLPLGNAKNAESLNSLLANSDFVSLHVPDTEMTRGMIGEKELAQMKDGAFLINASRGKVVDIEALRGALADGRLAGAAIDVYPQEPAKAGDAFESPLRGLDNVILTPHIGGSTQEAQANIGREVARALVDYMHAGNTVGSVTLPHLDAPPIASGSARILNVHRNVPGVLSAVTRAVADSNVNITRQQLATKGDVGLLHIDVAAGDAKAVALAQAIRSMDTSVKTRLVGGA